MNVEVNTFKTEINPAPGVTLYLSTARVDGEPLWITSERHHIEIMIMVARHHALTAKSPDEACDALNSIERARCGLSVIVGENVGIDKWLDLDLVPFIDQIMTEHDDKFGMKWVVK